MNSHTVMYGVIGDPIHHSKSPIMLTRAFKEAGMNAAYAAFHIAPDKLEAAVRGIKALGFGGINVTIPHKQAIMPLLDDIDDDAREIGAVNTVVIKDGKLIGYNTDGIGYVRSLKEETGFRIQGKRLLLIGAGGAARGVAYALSREQPAAIHIANRTLERADELARDIGRFAECRGHAADSMNDLPPMDLIVNTTSVGMHPDTSRLPVDEAWLNRQIGVGTTVSDLVYNPLTTAFLAAAARRGARTHSGLGMFIYQGAYAFEYWTGLSAPVAAMRDEVERSLQL